LDLDAAQIAVDHMRELAQAHDIDGTEDARYGARIAALRGDLEEAVRCYVAFLHSDLELAASAPRARDWVLTHVTCQVRELRDVHGDALAERFCTRLEAACADAGLARLDPHLGGLLHALGTSP